MLVGIFVRHNGTVPGGDFFIFVPSDQGRFGQDMMRRQTRSTQMEILKDVCDVVRAKRTSSDRHELSIRLCSIDDQ